MNGREMEGTMAAIGAVTGKTIVTTTIAKGRVAAVVQLRHGRHFLPQSHLPQIMATAEDRRWIALRRQGVMIGIVMAMTAGRAGLTEATQLAPFPTMPSVAVAATARNDGRERRHMAAIPGLGASSDPQTWTETTTPSAIAHRLLMTVPRAVLDNLAVMLAGARRNPVVVCPRVGRHIGAKSMASGTTGT